MSGGLSATVTKVNALPRIRCILAPLAGLRGLLDGFGQTNLANLHRWLDFRVVMVRMRPEDFAVRLHQIWPGS